MENINNKVQKNERGITLIALVVTIIVLIILAGISINLVLGDNGIITKAKEARENYAIAADEEKGILAGGESLIDELLAKNKTSLDVTWEISDYEQRDDEDNIVDKGKVVKLTYKNVEELTDEEVEILEHDAGIKCTQREKAIQVAKENGITYEELLRDELEHMEVDHSMLTTIQQLEDKIEEVTAGSEYPIIFDEMIYDDSEVAKEDAERDGISYKQFLVRRATKVDNGTVKVYENEFYPTRNKTYNLSVGSLLSKNIQVNGISNIYTILVTRDSSIISPTMAKKKIINEKGIKIASIRVAEKYDGPSGYNISLINQYSHRVEIIESDLPKIIIKDTSEEIDLSRNISKGYVVFQEDSEIYNKIKDKEITIKLVVDEQEVTWNGMISSK